MKLKAKLKRGIIVEPIEINNKDNYFTWWDGQFSGAIPSEKVYEIETFKNVEEFILEE